MTKSTRNTFYRSTKPPSFYYELQHYCFNCSLRLLIGILCQLSEFKKDNVFKLSAKSSSLGH
jgi:hypothetical protein